MEPDVQALTAKIGLRLRKARKAQILSLSQLSAHTGGVLSKSRISNYEQSVASSTSGKEDKPNESMGGIEPASLAFKETQDFKHYFPLLLANGAVL